MDVDKEVELHLKRFAQRLKEIRQKRKISQTELGELARVNFSQISRYERGSVHPTADVIVRLSQALGVSVGDLFDDGEILESRLPTDPDIINKLREIQELPLEDQGVVKNFLDAFLMRKRLKDLAAS